MSRSRRMMAVIVAALLIAAMILPGLQVKVEAAEKPKVKISLVGDNQTFEAGETKTLTLQITNNSGQGQELKNVEVAPDMSKKKAGAWPFEKDWKQYSEKIDSIPDGESKSVSFDFTRREGAKKNNYTIPFSVYVQGSDEAIVTDSIFVYAKNETVTPDPAPGDNSQNQGDAGNGSATGSGSDGSDMNVAAGDGAVAYSGGGDGGSSSDSGSVPRVIVTGFDTNPAEVHAGSNFTLTIHLKNTSKKTKVQNMLFELEAPTEGSDEQSTAPAFLPTSGSNSIYLDGIKANGTADISIDLNAKADLLQKPYSINLSMKYEDSQATQIDSTSSISIPVKQDPRFEFSEFEISPQSIEVGGEANVMCSLYNLGRIKLYNVKARFEGNGIKKQEVFIGNVDAGATGSIDAMLEGEKATDGNSKITMTLSYEDESGNISETTKDFEMEVTEPIDDSDMMTNGEIEESTGGFPIVPVIVGLVIVAAVVTVIVFMKKKKKKQMLNEEEELLDELDRSSEDERE